MGALEAGTLVAGKYRVRRRIGAGGMGAVYEGEHVEIGKRVAIKVIEHQHARSAELAARFKREARAASAVESEHIVQVFDVGDDPTAGLYMVMEFLSGEDLSERLAKNGGRLPSSEAVPIVLQAARALAKAHAAGVVHRDLKPANLFLTRREDDSICVKILDFGISKLTRPEGEGAAKTSSLTREGSVMGTPMYMSPEQAQGLAVDVRTDVWSLGAVLYEVLSGRTAFEERSTYEQMIVQIVTQKPKPLLQAAPWVPEPLARVVDATLVHDVAQRLPDAATLVKRLADAAKLSDSSSSASASTRDATVLADERAVPSRSDPNIEVRVQTGPAFARAEAPATGVGIEIGTRTQLDAGIPPKRSPLIWLGVAAFAALAIGLIIVTLALRAKAPTASAAGLVTPASVAAPASAAPPVSTPAPAPLPPLETANDAPSSSAPATATAKPAAPPQPRASATTAKPRPQATTMPAKPSSQYGAAGVSTAY